ncbi:NADH-quinone oxidoreductase subunit M [Klebsiella pneumoniae]|nr:NADH-quinone oxidoreductase subunit M [Klebsiella pneumoniae]
MAVGIRAAVDPRFGISIHLAIDGLSLLMVVLTGLLGVLAVLCSWREIENTGASSTST